MYLMNLYSFILCKKLLKISEKVKKKKYKKKIKQIKEKYNIF